MQLRGAIQAEQIPRGVLPETTFYHFLKLKVAEKNLGPR